MKKADVSLLQDRIERMVRERFLRDPVPGFRLPSEREMAREFGVSVPTLRRVLGRLAAAGLLERRRGSGTFIADSRKGFSKPVGIVCNVDLAELPSPAILSRILSTCYRLLRGEGYPTRIYLGDETEGYHADYAVPPEFLADIRNNVLGGVIALATFPTAEWMEPLEKHKVPVVGQGELHRNMASENHMLFVIQAARHLLSAGRKRVAYIQGAPFQRQENAHFYPGKSQVSDPETIRCLLESLGLEVHEGWFRNEWRINSPSVGWSAFREIWSAPDRPDGVIIANSLLAEGVCRAVRECGIAVPENLILVGAWPKDEPSPPPVEMVVLDSNPRRMGENLVGMLTEAMRTGSITHPRRIVNCMEAPDEEPIAPALLAT